MLLCVQKLAANIQSAACIEKWAHSGWKSASNGTVRMNLNRSVHKNQNKHLKDAKTLHTVLFCASLHINDALIRQNIIIILQMQYYHEVYVCVP